MLEILVVVLIVLWLTGNLAIPGLAIPRVTLFSLNGHPITLWNILIFIVTVWAASLLPSPFKEIAGVLLVLWVLSLLGIIAFAGLTNLLVIVMIVWLVASLLKRR